MPLFRKKPVVVEAEQFFPDRKPWPAGVRQRTRQFCSDSQCGDSTWDHECDLGEDLDAWEIKTLEGMFEVTPGDWIITGIQGERYPCKPDIFEATYEPVERMTGTDQPGP